MIFSHRIVASVAVVAALFIAGCSPNREEIALKVQQSMQARVDTDPALAESRIRILNVLVIHEAGNKYQGLAVVRSKRGAEHQVPVQVVAEGDNVIWTTQPGAFLFLVQEEVAAALNAAPEPAHASPARTPQEPAGPDLSVAELMTRGEAVYRDNCAACHRADGKGAGPIKALDGSPIVTGDPAAHIAVLLNGGANGAMPSWRRLSDTEIAAVITYTKNAWSNRTGQVVQPTAVFAARR
jgi:mono/diheme cytochrome c family protein